MPPLLELFAVLFLVGVGSSGITEVIKTLCKKWVGSDVNSNDPVWWQAMFRVIPICVGTAGGHQFFDWPWGACVGMSAGVLCVLLYKKAKTIITGLRTPEV